MWGIKTDEQGQLINRSVRAKDVADRITDELIGICRGLIADNKVNHDEASFLLDWVTRNRDYAHTYPFNILYSRLSEMLKDGILEDEESAELLSMLNDLAGGKPISDEHVSNSTSLPLTDPAPEVSISGSSFVFTGVFTTGPRKHLEQLVIDLGGIMHKDVTTQTNFLVIGDIGSHDWKHSSFGRKIEKAMKYNDKGSEILILSEAHWAMYL